MEISEKLKIELPYKPVIPFLVIYIQKNQNQDLKDSDIYCSIYSQ